MALCWVHLQGLLGVSSRPAALCRLLSSSQEGRESRSAQIPHTAPHRVPPRARWAGPGSWTPRPGPVTTRSPAREHLRCVRGLEFRTLAQGTGSPLSGPTRLEWPAPGVSGTPSARSPAWTAPTQAEERRPLQSLSCGGVITVPKLRCRGPCLSLLWPSCPESQPPGAETGMLTGPVEHLGREVTHRHGRCFQDRREVLQVCLALTSPLSRAGWDRSGGGGMA